MAKRPNGTGYVYKRGETWTARVVDHYVPADNKTGFNPVYKTKGGFARKKDAINYVSVLLQEKRNEHPPKTFKANFDAWQTRYTGRVTDKTLKGYAQAFAHFEKLYYMTIDTISANDLQAALDSCKHGKRTKALMKMVASMVFRYAMDDDQIFKNNAENLYVGSEETVHYEPLSDEEVEIIANSGEFYADYVLVMCYMGYRPSELFSFTKADYHTDDTLHYIVGGIKTEAGKNRAVTIPPRIQPIIEKRLAVEGTEFLFPRYDLDRRGGFSGSLSKMPSEYFNKSIWKPMMERLGIVGKSPYATRHTYSNKIKNVTGSDKDKASLMGHTSYEMTKKHYQSTTLNELKQITDQLG